MKAISIIGKVFEPFGTALFDDPVLVERKFERVLCIRSWGECVGACWHSDNVALGISLIAAPEVLRWYVFPWFRKIVKQVNARDAETMYCSDGDSDAIVGNMGFVNYILWNLRRSTWLK